MRRSVTILAGLVFAGALVWVTLQQIRVSCEVCMVDRGRRLCETAAAVSRDEAVIQARSSACARLTSGVTDGMRCNRSAPVSVTCTE